MQRFPCPFCGLRDEREFLFAGEAGKVRPATEGEISETEWRDYLHGFKNELRESREIWVHLPCQEYFIMRRDTLTMDVLGTEQLRKDVS